MMDTTIQQAIVDAGMDHAINNNINDSDSVKNAKERCSAEIGNDYFWHGWKQLDIGLFRAWQQDKNCLRLRTAINF